KESPTPVADAPEVGMSAAALESLKELVGDGKVDSQLLEELEGEVSTPVTKTETAKAAEVTKEPEKAKEPAVELAKKEDVFKKKAVVEKDNSDKPAAKKSLPKKENLSEDATDSNKSIADSFVRVNVKVLDRIMNIVGELVLNRNQVVQYSNLQSDHEFNRLAQQLNIITSELQSEVMSTRMQPVGNTLSKFERLVRDFSRQSGKKIMLKLSGQGTELDKTLIEAIKDPLVHIIRNACDHGLELPQEREEAGKSADGLILIKAYNESGQVVIEIVDDGRGLNKDKIMEKALEKGVMTQEKLDSMSDSQIFNLIFAAGFSTAEQITNISGRGVGMDVVKTNIERIGGTVSVSSNDGAGSTFKLRIPLTLAIVPALVIKSKNESFAIPQQNLVELVRLETAEDKVLLETIQGSEFLKLRGVLTPIFRLKETLSLDRVNEKNNQLQKIVANNSLDGASSESSERQSKENQFEDALNIVILNAEEHVFGIVVEEILDTEEIVVKPLNNSLKELTLFGGATIMGDGKVALILDALGFLNTVNKGQNSVIDASLANMGDEAKFVDGSEFQENLLFKLTDGREYAIPLTLVSRLEEFPVSKIERTGNQPIVRYLDAPMPLINIEKTLKLDGTSTLDSYKDLGLEAVSCIVTSIQGRNYGLIVEEVLDISIDNMAIDDTAVDREGIMGTVFINEKTISLIDLYTIIEAQNIGGFNRKADTDLNKNKNKTILVVDDSPMYRKLEADLLLSMGFTVETANHGGEGFDMISNKEYDLLITD
ncbi:hypothetical protein HOB30_01290, partial [Candidatus Falkowbacteria bacterium]|nr:hypothetical protein [Candidatus Falkowbacteria bacterium]